MQLGELWLSIYKQSDGAEALRKAHQAFSITLAFARQTGQKALIAQASGALGHLYEFSTDYPTAETLTRQAIFASQSTPVQHYRWEWQLARLLRKQQQLDEANSTYRRVLELLQNIRSGLNSGRQSAAVTFSSEVRPVYFGLVEVLLQQASGRSGPDKASLLKEARGVAEQLKAAELEDYFRDECVANARAKNRTLDDISANTAIIYPLVLEERLELLVSVAGQIHQITIPISAQELARIVEELQINLQIRTHWQFYYSAELLYRRMIQPILPILQSFQVDTLVIVPDGPLRMIPLGALYNATSKRFLIEDYALVITPGLELTDPRPLQRNEIMLLLNGLSEEVQQFPPLPSVKNEIASIRDLFGQPQVLMNNEFTYASLSRSLTEMPFSIVHIASHGQFDQDPENTFLLTYEDKLTMNRLERLLKSGQARDKPVELLTLSACQTAVGDERAALGLAGVAIKAGARSALASLWFVNDDSTAELISEFYRQLYQSDISKAQALRNAQVKLITEKTYYRHPFYWSPFLLIGNWL
ncbi:MAG: CHAT domain-containing protein [Pseudomonadota bacterium]